MTSPTASAGPITPLPPTSVPLPRLHYPFLIPLPSSSMPSMSKKPGYDSDLGHAAMADENRDPNVPFERKDNGQGPSSPAQTCIYGLHGPLPTSSYTAWTSLSSRRPPPLPQPLHSPRQTRSPHSGTNLLRKTTTSRQAQTSTSPLLHPSATTPGHLERPCVHVLRPARVAGEIAFPGRQAHKRPTGRANTQGLREVRLHSNLHSAVVQGGASAKKSPKVFPSSPSGHRSDRIFIINVGVGPQSTSLIARDRISAICGSGERFFTDLVLSVLPRRRRTYVHHTLPSRAPRRGVCSSPR